MPFGQLWTIVHSAAVLGAQFGAHFRYYSLTLWGVRVINMLPKTKEEPLWKSKEM